MNKIKGKDLELRARRKGKDLGWIKASEIIEFIVRELPLCEEEAKRDLLYNKDQQIQQLQEDKLELLNKIEHIIHTEQFKGSRDYNEGCIEGIKAVLRFIEEQTNCEGENENRKHK